MDDLLPRYEEFLLVLGQRRPELLKTPGLELSATDDVQVFSKLDQIRDKLGSRMGTIARAYVRNIPFVDLRARQIDYDATSRYFSPADITAGHCMVVDVVGKVIVVASNTPQDPTLRHMVRQRLNEIDPSLQVHWVFADAEDLQAHLSGARTASELSVNSMSHQIQADSITAELHAEAVASMGEVYSLGEILAKFEAASKGAPIIPKDLVSAILVRAYSPDNPSARATDVHIEPGPLDKDCMVRFRMDGELIPQGGFPMQIYTNVSSTIKQMSNGMDPNKHHVHQDGRIGFGVRMADGAVKRVSCRVSALAVGDSLAYTAHESFTFRLLDNEVKIAELSEICMDAETLKLWKQVLDLQDGLVLLVGPTGSGKTTTLARFMMEVVSPKHKSISVEDPIEYVLSNVQQSQVDEPRGLTFAAAIRQMLRSDPDIILVGEVRDEESASLAVRAAITGHQVFSTLHTGDSVSAITRLLDLKIEPSLLANTLKMVGSQRLVRRLCLNCREEYTPPAGTLELLPEKYRASRYFRGAGCARCRGRGYTGRMAILESFYVDSDVQALIARKPAGLEAEVRKHNFAKYSAPLFERALLAASNGFTSLDEAMRLMSEITTF